jgi:hypothetical protein
VSRLSAIGAELLSLFVDDWGFALSILAWLAFVFLCIRWLDGSASLIAALLFGGLAAILAGSAKRASFKRRPEV